jgi:hypothetical protein
MKIAPKASAITIRQEHEMSWKTEQENGGVAEKLSLRIFRNLLRYCQMLL